MSDASLNREKIKIKAIEEFFKNRIVFTCNDIMGDVTLNHDFGVFDAVKYNCKIFNPFSLNIKNSFDFVEKLTPLINYISSTFKKFKENAIKNYVNHQKYSFTIEIAFKCGYQLFQVCETTSFSFESSLNVNEIKETMKEKIE